MTPTTSALEIRRQQPEEKHQGRERGIKSERLGARLTRRQKEVLQRAADLTGRTLTDFIVSSALDRAEDTIRTHQILELSERDARAFYDALQNPPRLNERMYEALRWHRENVEAR